MGLTLDLPRHWASSISLRPFFLVCILLTHAAVLWVVGNSARDVIVKPHEDLKLVDVVETVKPPPVPEKFKIEPATITPSTIFAPPTISTVSDEPTVTAFTLEGPPPIFMDGSGTAEPPDMIELPQTSFALSEPPYPPPSIRMGETGTVLIGVFVLPNGRVGDVRLERSSGFPRLDAAALKEARKWRLAPGTRNGVAASMWTQLPVTFRLVDGKR